MKTKDNRLLHIGDILDSALGRYRPAMDIEMTRIWDVWDDAVGKLITTNAKPSSFRDGILIVKVSSSPWIHQLKFLEKKIISDINKRLESLAVKKIRFKIGKILS